MKFSWCAAVSLSCWTRSHFVHARGKFECLPLSNCYYPIPLRFQILKLETLCVATFTNNKKANTEDYSIKRGFSKFSNLAFWAVLQMQRYESGKIIGKGAYGVVTECIDRVTSERLALKTCRMFDEDEAISSCALREIVLLKQVLFRELVIVIFHLTRIDKYCNRLSASTS
jgi:hypothetical protein